MKVTVSNITDAEKLLPGDYAIDPRFGLPVIGEEIALRTRDYHDKTKEWYLRAVIRNRRWIFSDNNPKEPELRLLVEVQP
jgi:hypothetical protein